MTQSVDQHCVAYLACQCRKIKLYVTLIIAGTIANEHWGDTCNTSCGFVILQYE